MIEVWIVVCGDMYEGGSVKAVCASRAAAGREAKRIMAEDDWHNPGAWRFVETGGALVGGSLEVRGYWRAGCDYVQIERHEVTG